MYRPVTSPHHGHRPCCCPSFALRAYTASVSLAPRLPRRWNRQLHLYPQLSLARLPKTRAALDSVRTTECLLSDALRLFLTLLSLQVIIRTEYNLFPKLVAYTLSRFEISCTEYYFATRYYFCLRYSCRANSIYSFLSTRLRIYFLLLLFFSYRHFHSRPRIKM